MAIHAQMYSENVWVSLCGSQDWMVDNGGCGGGFTHFCFNPQQKQQKNCQQPLQFQVQFQNEHHQQERVLPTQCFDPSSSVPSLLDNSQSVTTAHGGSYQQQQQQQSMDFSPSLAPHVEKHRQDIDQYVRSMNERLRLTLQEQRQQQYAVLMRRMETKTTILLREKDEEIAQAARKTMELEEFLRKLEKENQIWQRVARENEAMVVSLNNTLYDMRLRASSCVNNGADDAESWCDLNRENEGGEAVEITGENRGLCFDVEQSKKIVECRGCNSRSSSVLFLPCRHLCSCIYCEAVLYSCPVCGMEKKASIEALIF